MRNRLADLLWWLTERLERFAYWLEKPHLKPVPTEVFISPESFDLLVEELEKPPRYLPGLADLFRNTQELDNVDAPRFDWRAG